MILSTSYLSEVEGSAANETHFRMSQAIIKRNGCLNADEYTMTPVKTSQEPSANQVRKPLREEILMPSILLRGDSPDVIAFVCPNCGAHESWEYGLQTRHFIRVVCASCLSRYMVLHIVLDVVIARTGLSLPYELE